MKMTMYGIPSCESVQVARDWLEEQGFDYAFHDYRKGGVPLDKMAEWLKEHGDDELINRRGATWKKLPKNRQKLEDDKAILALMKEFPTVIKRPILETESGLIIGYSDRIYTNALCGGES